MCVKRGQPPFHPSLAEAGHQIREALPARERGLAPFHSPSGLARRSRAIDAKARFASRLTRLTRLVGLMCGNFCTDASDRYLGCPRSCRSPFGWAGGIPHHQTPSRLPGNFTPAGTSRADTTTDNEHVRMPNRPALLLLTALVAVLVAACGGASGQTDTARPARRREP